MKIQTTKEQTNALVLNGFDDGRMDLVSGAPFLYPAIPSYTISDLLQILPKVILGNLHLAIIYLNDMWSVSYVEPHNYTQSEKVDCKYECKQKCLIDALYEMCFILKKGGIEWKW